MKTRLLSALERSLTIVGDLHIGVRKLHPEDHEDPAHCECQDAKLYRDLFTMIEDVKSAPAGFWPEKEPVHG